MKKNNEFFRTKFLRLSTRFLVSVASVSSLLLPASCSDDDNVPPDVTKKNPTTFIKDAEKVAMLRSMKDVDGSGRLYEINYTADYKLDDVLKSGFTETNQLFNYVAYLLYDSLPGKKAQVSFDAGCSAFAVPDRQSGNFLMGRNYDFCHATEDGKGYKSIAAIIVHTAPEGGKKSISMVDGMQLGYGQGFYTDGDTDLSLLMGLPYAALDGINEDGFAVSVLKLDGKPTQQREEGKKKIFTTIAMRMLLDRASTVEQAKNMLKEYNMCMDNDTASYHFFMADATGDYAIVEYTNSNTGDYPKNIEFLQGNDTLRCVTNFYVSPTMGETKYGMKYSKHGMDRYVKLRETLQENNYTLTPDEGRKLLKLVSQGPEVEETTGFTQWSEIFNLNKKTVTMSILREWNKKFEFGIE